MQELSKARIEKAVKYLTPLAEYMSDDNCKNHMNTVLEAAAEYADIVDASPKEIGEILAGM